MSYAMFIDDERFPHNVTWMQADFYCVDWVICRTWAEVLYHIHHFGFPDTISFDHDLGKNETTGYDIAKKLVDMLMDGDYELPENFRFFVHSKNPVGAENIQRYIDNYLENCR